MSSRGGTLITARVVLGSLTNLLCLQLCPAGEHRPGAGAVADLSVAVSARARSGPPAHTALRRAGYLHLRALPIHTGIRQVSEGNYYLLHWIA